MKTWIAWGALSIAVVVVAFRPAPAAAPAPERRVQVPVRVEFPVEVPRIEVKSPVETPRVIDDARVETRTLERPAPAAPASGRTVTATELAHEKMLFLFERELDLRGDQRRFMEEVLARRELEITDLQRGIVASGIFRVREYDDRIRALQASSYEKMKEVLDEPQRRRFEGLLAEGRLGDGIQFAIPPNMVMLQD